MGLTIALENLGDAAAGEESPAAGGDSGSGQLAGRGVPLVVGDVHVDDDVRLRHVASSASQPRPAGVRGSLSRSASVRRLWTPLVSAAVTLGRVVAPVLATTASADNLKGPGRHQDTTHQPASPAPIPTGRLFGEVTPGPRPNATTPRTRRTQTRRHPALDSRRIRSFLAHLAIGTAMSDSRVLERAAARRRGVLQAAGPGHLGARPVAGPPISPRSSTGASRPTRAPPKRLPPRCSGIRRVLSHRAR